MARELPGSKELQKMVISLFLRMRALANRHVYFSSAILAITSVLLYGNLLHSLSSQTVSAVPLHPIATAVSSTVENSGRTASSPESCTPSAYMLPKALDLDNQPVGLTQVVDPTSQYQIYGTNGTQLRTEIQQCAPNLSVGTQAEFTSETNYQINWSYSYTILGNDMCQATKPKVGVHISMVLPLWQPNSSATQTFVNQWQSFISNLTIHENGHVALDEQYANQMVSDLQNYPVMSCDILQQSVTNTLNNDVLALNIANDQYDTATNHGATQGAILPN